MQLRSSSQNFLAVPRSRLKTYGDRALSAVAPRLWNQLPPELRGVTSVDQFRTHLKTYLNWPTMFDFSSFSQFYYVL